VDDSPRIYTGASGAQSSILLVLDALLGIQHHNPDLKYVLSGLQKYMPPTHQKYLAKIPTGILRKFIDNQKNFLPILTDTFDSIIDEIVTFRKKHLEFAAKYIVRQASGVVTDGTPFMEYLRDHLKTTKRSQYGFKYTKAAFILGVVKNVRARLPEPLSGLEPRIVDVEPQFSGTLKFYSGRVWGYVVLLVVIYLVMF